MVFLGGTANNDEERYLTVKLARALGLVFIEHQARIWHPATCNCYLKTINLRQMSKEVALPVERIIIVAMDVAAQEAGYT